jgi:hypothetical protein
VPTREEIPDRHPVIEHMERRLERAAPPAEPVAPERTPGAGLLGLLAGGTVGGLFLGVFLVYLEMRP